MQSQGNLGILGTHLDAEVTQRGWADRERGGQVLRSTNFYLQEGRGAKESEKELPGAGRRQES